MPDPVSAITSGSSIIGGLMSSDAASSAADTQAAAANRAADLQYKMFKEQQATQKPFLEAGYSAENKLLSLLGLAGNAPTAPTAPTALGPKASRAQKDQYAKDLEKYNTDLAAYNSNLASYNAMRSSPEYGSLMKDFSMADFQQDPGYAFRMSEGLKALDRTAASRGGLLSGAALRGAERYGQDLASQEYTNAFNRYQTNRANKLNPLQSLAGQGQTTANTLGAAGQNYASNAGNAYMNAGNAAASGYIGSANAWSNALGNAANTYQQNQLMKQIFGGGGGITGGFGSGTAAIPMNQSFDYYYNMGG